MINLRDHLAVPGRGSDNAMPANAPPNGIKLRLYRMVNSRLGLHVSAPWTELHFRAWKMWHRHATFADFYAAMAVATLQYGGSHKTLGTRQFLSGSLFGRAVSWDDRSHAERGLGHFETLLEMGLQPSHRCIDFGCGSLRVGQHLIRYLNPGSYLGLDLVSHFWEAGMRLMPARLCREKSPRFDIINAQSLERGLGFDADFIVSFAVMKHVPPAELRQYLRNIVSMMRSDTVAVITYCPATASRRSGATNWSYDEGDIIDALKSVEPLIQFEFRPHGGNKKAFSPRTATLVLRRRKEMASTVGPRGVQDNAGIFVTRP